MNFRLSAAVVGIGLALLILHLLRRDHVYLRDAFFWLLTAAASIVFAIFPNLIDVLGRAAGVQYPPALLLALVCVVLTIKGLLADISLAAVRRDIRRLSQSVALLDRGASIGNSTNPLEGR